jgi:glycyl-radical enzyme activating protein
MYRRSNCLRCHGCIERGICGQGAISAKSGGEYIVIDRSACEKCEEITCAEQCYHDALKIAGEVYTLGQLMLRVERDARYWGAEGGVTLSGGEMAMQHQFAAEFLQRCQERYINTAVESCSLAPWSHLAQIYENVDWAFTDIKHMDSAKHKDATGAGNALILENTAKIAQLGREGKLRHIVRVPLIQGYNSDAGNIKATIGYLKEIGAKEVNILPFHRLGSSKYGQLGRTYACRDMEGCPEELLASVQARFDLAGITCYVGSETPF